jgi:hypothetical protein
MSPRSLPQRLPQQVACFGRRGRGNHPRCLANRPAWLIHALSGVWVQSLPGGSKGAVAVGSLQSRADQIVVVVVVAVDMVADPLEPGPEARTMR